MMTSTPSTVSATAIIDFVRSHPLWPLQFLIVYLGNPIVFILYFVVMANSTAQDGIQVCGTKTFTSVGDLGSNTSRMNVVLFVVMTLPLYILWFAFQVAVVVPMYVRVLMRGSFRTFNAATFVSNYGNVAACLWAIPGLLNVLAWSSTSGMEGNVMGMIVAPILLVSAVAYVALWFGTLSAALEEPVGVIVGYHLQEDHCNDNNNSSTKKMGGTSSRTLPAVS